MEYLRIKKTLRGRRAKGLALEEGNHETVGSGKPTRLRTVWWNYRHDSSQSSCVLEYS